MTLPHDYIGSVLDSADLGSQLATPLSVLVDLDVLATDVIPTVEINPCQR